MARRFRALLAVGGLLGLALALAPVAVAGDPCYHGYTIPPTTSAASDVVELEPCAFVPTTARVAPGTTVTFASASDFAHLVTGANAAWGDRDREIPAGASVSVRFDRPGIYPYSCALHRGMSGVIVVGEASAADISATAATTPAAGGEGTTMAAIAGLAGLAIVGWGLVLAQQRRRVQA
jgi:plastocyanin